MPEIVESFAQTLVKDFAQSAVKAIGGKVGGAIGDAILSAIGIGGDAATQQALAEINSKLDSMQNQLNSIESELSNDFNVLVGLVDYVNWNVQNTALNDKSITTINGEWLNMTSGRNDPDTTPATAETWAAGVVNNILDQDVMNNIHNNVVGQGGALSILALYVNVLRDGINQGKYNTLDATQEGTADIGGWPSTKPVQSYINYYSSLANAQLKAAIMLKAAYVIQNDPTRADLQYKAYLQNIQLEQQMFLSCLTDLLNDLYQSTPMRVDISGGSGGDSPFNQKLISQYERDMFCTPELIDWKGVDPLQGHAYEMAEAAISNFLPVNPVTGLPSARIVVYQVEDSGSYLKPNYYEPELIPGDNILSYEQENVDINVTMYENRDLSQTEPYKIERRNFWVAGGDKSVWPQTFYLKNHSDILTSSGFSTRYFQGYERYLEGGAGITLYNDTDLAVVRFTPYVYGDLF